ncbi:MAG: cytochrome c [Bdellovibrionaceae bacterium]|nr:cytochrome c [Bdellovibrionales bacterium]MCB9254347.1 cytochrome c [Pseudobdellovibrionaceae bacterium]
MKAISILSMFFALSLSVQANTYYGNHGNLGNYNLNTGRYGLDSSTQSELASIMALANSCGFPLNIDPNAFASAPPTTTFTPPATEGVGSGLPLPPLPGTGSGNPSNGAPTTGSNTGGTGSGNKGGDSGATGGTAGDTGGETGGTKTSATDDQTGGDKAAFRSTVEGIVNNTCLSCHGAGGKASSKSASALIAALESGGSALANKMVSFGANLSAGDIDAIKNFAGK